MLREFSPIEQQALDHVWIHTARWLDLAERDGLRVMVRGEGCRLFDAHGRAYLDGLSGLYVVNVGHGRAEIGEAMAKQARELAYVSAASYTNLPAVQLADVLAGLTPGDLDRFFFCSGGSEAIESAMKIAKQVQAMRGFPKRYKIIARRGGYHGATFGAMSITSSRSEKYLRPVHVRGQLRAVAEPLPQRFRGRRRGGRPALRRGDRAGDPGAGAGYGGGGHRRAGLGVEFEPCALAASIGSGCGQICDTHGVLLVMDEVINGFGRTGTMFATEQFGVVPDLMTMAKGLSSGYAPIAAVAVGNALFEEFKKQDVALAHLLTFGGQAVSCAAALKNIEILRREELPQRSAQQGKYLLSLLQELRSHPTVGDVRGLGLMCAVELVKDKATKEPFGVGPAAASHPFCRRLIELMEERGLLTRVFMALQLCPPLVVSRDEIDQMVTIVDESLSLAEREFGFA